MDINEQIKSKQTDLEAERYLKKYRPMIEALEKDSMISKVRSVRSYDVYNLGRQLEMWEHYKMICEEEGTASQLGKLPTVALDIITASYGTNPLSVIASIQPIQEEIGLIYFKKLVAQNTRGNVTAGQIISDAVNMEQVAPVGYASDRLTQSGPTTTAAVLAYTFNLTQIPVRPGSVTIAAGSIVIPNIDNAEGLILGNGIQGTINYVTGAVSITFAADPGAGVGIAATYATDFEAALDIPQIQFKMTSKQIQARVFALKSTIGMEQSYAMRQRFGMVAEDEVANDLVSSINAETMNIAIAQLSAAAGAAAFTWNATPDAGVSYVDHKQAFKDQVAKLESVILGAAGRGIVNVMIAGRGVCSLIQTLPGFTKISDGTSIGPHIFGTLDGCIIVRVPNTAVLATGDVLGIYNGTSPFESAFVYSPYMPLLITTAMPTGQNPLLNQKAAAVWAGTDVLVPQFVKRFTVLNV